MPPKQHLIDKRDELIWALSHQGYRDVDLGIIFNIKHRSTIMRIINRMPKDWTPKWIKVV